MQAAAPSSSDRLRMLPRRGSGHAPTCRNDGRLPTRDGTAESGRARHGETLCPDLATTGRACGCTDRGLGCRGTRCAQRATWLILEPSRPSNCLVPRVMLRSMRHPGCIEALALECELPLLVKLPYANATQIAPGGARGRRQRDRRMPGSARHAFCIRLVGRSDLRRFWRLHTGRLSGPVSGPLYGPALFPLMLHKLAEIASRGTGRAPHRLRRHP